jgi:hypothetical protein
MARNIETKARIASVDAVLPRARAARTSALRTANAVVLAAI